MPRTGRSSASWGRRVRLNRRYQDLTQAELAERAQLSRSFVAVFESGRHGIDVTSLRRLAEALGVPLPALVDIHPTTRRQTARPRRTGADQR